MNHLQIRFRPHHFLCALGFQGKGYSPSFIDGFSKITEILRSPTGDDTPIAITSTTDSICEPCPHRRGTACATDEKIQTLDQAHARALALPEKATITWGQAKERIKNQISIERFHSICEPCEWKKLGVCEDALKKLRHGMSIATILFLSGLIFQGNARAAVPPDLSFQKQFPTEWESMHSKIKAKTRLESLIHEIDRKIGQLRGFDLQSPYLPIRQRQTEWEGALSVLKGFILFQQNRIKESNQAFERGFEFLEKKGNWIRWNSPETLHAFSLGCDKLKTPACASRLRIILSAFPKTSIEYKSLVQPDWLKQDVIESSSADRLYQTYKANDADSELYAKLMTAIRSKDKSQSKDLILQFYKDFPKSSLKERVLLWEFLTLKTPPAAFTEKPFSYFALHFAQLTNADLYSSIQAAPYNSNSTGSPSSLGFLSPGEQFLWSRIQHLNQSKKTSEYSAFDLKEMKPKAKHPSGWVIELAKLQAHAGNIMDSFVAVSEIFDRGEKTLFNSEGMNLVFPLLHWDLILQTANDLEMDPVLILSLIKQESAFQFDAVSSSGALGMMQLMPFTASETSAKTELRTLVDPAINIKVGTLYLKQLLRRFDGNIALALASYNAGPVAVDRWQKEFDPDRSLDFLTFIESIPYKETRNYVSGIARNYYWYSNILKRPITAPMRELFWKSSSQPTR